MHDTATKLTVTRLDTDDPAVLFCQYTGQTGPQSCFIALDLEDGRLWADYDGEIGNGVPESVWHQRTLRWALPVVPTAQAANDLLDTVAADATAVLAGASIDWDGSNWRGSLDETAAAAAERIADRVDADGFAPADTVIVYDAGDWFAHEADADIAARLGITAASTDTAVTAAAEAETTEAASTNFTDGYVLLRGAEEYLTGLRNDLRDDA